MKKFQYRANEYFNEVDMFVFDSGYKVFESKVHFIGGYWWTNESMNFKATTVKCYKS